MALLKYELLFGTQKQKDFCFKTAFSAEIRACREGYGLGVMLIQFLADGRSLRQSKTPSKGFQKKQLKNKISIKRSFYCFTFAGTRGGPATGKSAGRRERERERERELYLEFSITGGLGRRPRTEDSARITILTALLDRVASIWRRPSPDSGEKLAGWYRWAWSLPPGDTRLGCVARVSDSASSLGRPVCTGP